jgi:aminopeptidase N
MLTVTHELDATGTFANTYLKHTIAYFYLQDYLGKELFAKALHYYISQWEGKHPVPFDFVNCMNRGAGKNLDWY